MSDELKAEVLIGDDAEKFVESELGRIVLGMAEQDLRNAMLDFAEADITNQGQVAKIQQEVKVAIRFDRYLRELIEKGREALTAWRQQNES